MAYGGINMEYRKIISFGKSSFVVSLPKSWVVQNKLQKGDVVYFEEDNNNLVLQPRRETTGDEEKEIVIDVDGKTTPWLTREICTAYVQNYRKIVLRGKEVKNKVKELQSLIQGMIALEIMEQTSDTIIAKDFLNMDKVSLNELVRKMDIVTRTMFKECCQIFTEDTYESLNERDRDVNRLYFLLYRAVLYNLDNPTKSMKNFSLRAVDLLKLKMTGMYLEIIADEVRRVARYVRMLKISPAERKNIEVFLERVNDNFLQTMKSYYNKDIKLALELAEVKKNLEEELDVWEKDVAKINHLNQVINRLRRLIVGVHNVGRLVYTLI